MSLWILTTSVVRPRRNLYDLPPPKHPTQAPPRPVTEDWTPSASSRLRSCGSKLRRAAVPEPGIRSGLFDITVSVGQQVVDLLKAGMHPYAGRWWTSHPIQRVHVQDPLRVRPGDRRT